MRLYGRFPPPPAHSYPLAIPYVTAALMARLEAGHTLYQQRSRGFAFLLYATRTARHVSLFSRNHLSSQRRRAARAICRYSNVCRRGNTRRICFR